MSSLKYICTIDNGPDIFSQKSYSVEEFYKRLQYIRSLVEAVVTSNPNEEYIIEPEIEYINDNHSKPVVSEFTLYSKIKRAKEDIEMEIKAARESMEKNVMLQRNRINQLELEMAELEKG